MDGYNYNMSCNSNILNSFIQQTYGSVENATKLDLEANKREKVEKEAAEAREKAAISQMCKPINLIESMKLPTKLKSKELNSVTESHKNYKNYDHSLERNRSSGLGLISLSNEE